MSESIKQCRKWLLTINNPKEKEITHESILKVLTVLKGLKYACLSDEIGGEKNTYHTHCFCVYENPKSFQTMKNAVDSAHWDACKGSASQNRDYVFKAGKWEHSEKGTSKIPGTQTEWGEMPEERNCPKPELAFLYELIKSGLSNVQLLEQYPEYLFDTMHIDRIRLALKQEEYKNTWRNVEVVYINGKTALGKSRYVMESHGYENVFRVTDTRNPWDTYLSQDVVCFEEFSSSFQIQHMLNYLDGYPLKLPARYSDKVACYTKVYITSNIPLENQYPNIQEEQPDVWGAFLRRISKIMVFKSKTEIITYNSVDDYFNRNAHDSEFISVDMEQTELPFD